jgi:DNA-binding GntR family transcriptional regulator
MVGTSVMPVREAIRRLEETGLAARVAAHRGAVVREFTVGELIPVLVNVIDSLWLQCRPYKVIGATEALDHDDASLWTPQRAILEAARARDVKEATRLTKQSLASARQRLEKRLVSN